MSRLLVRLFFACLIGLLLPVGAGTTRASADQPWDFSNDAWAYLRAKTPPGSTPSIGESAGTPAASRISTVRSAAE